MIKHGMMMPIIKSTAKPDWLSLSKMIKVFFIYTITL